jgi:phytoene synthase
MEALFQIDAAMADVVARSSDAGLGRIKLAWWREQLEALDAGAPPAEPRLTAAAQELLPRGIAGTQLGELEVGWATLLDAEPEAGLVSERGALLFTTGASLLGADDPMLAKAGRLYALASVGRRGLVALLEPAREAARSLGRHRFARGVRPLTMLAHAAVRDLGRSEQEGSRARLGAMLAHRWSGRIG